MGWKLIIIALFSILTSKNVLLTKVDPDLAHPPPYPPLPFNPWELNYNAYYGNPGPNATMSHMFLFPTDDYDAQSNDNEDTLNRKMADLIMAEQFPTIRDQLDPEIDHFEATEIKKIKENLHKQIASKPKTRRQSANENLDWTERCINMGILGSCFHGFTEDEDSVGYTEAEKEANERRKLHNLENLTLAFLIHGRHRVRQAITIRNLVKDDKRYKLGYLFNRLRRLLYDQRKIYGSVSMLEESTAFRHMARTLQGYKLLLRLEVDIRSVIDLIKKIYYFEMDPKMYVNASYADIKIKKKKKEKIKS